MRHVESDLTAYLDGALDPAGAAAVEAHLSGCAACRAERDRLASALRVVAALPPPPTPSPTFGRTFWARVDAEPRPRRDSLGRLLVGRWAAFTALAGGAAAALVVLAAHREALRHERELAAHLDLFENYEVVASLGAVRSAEDAEVIAHLDELTEGRP